MTDTVKRDSAGLADDADEDTIELVLSPQDVRALSRAEAEACSEAVPVDPVHVPPCVGPPHSEPSKDAAKVDLELEWPKIPLESATVVALIGIVIASAGYRSASTGTARTEDPSTLVSTSTSTNTAPESQGEPVRVQNPFDRSEVFEFPPGTSEAAARQSVANLLLERGRDRLERPKVTRDLNSHRNDRPFTGSADSDDRLSPGPNR